MTCYVNTLEGHIMKGQSLLPAVLMGDMMESERPNRRVQKRQGSFITMTEMLCNLTTKLQLSE
jgi:hypothetical protein